MILMSISFGSNVFADDDRDDRTFSVMTQNLFMGTEFPELAAAKNYDDFVHAVTITYRNVLATLPIQRMVRIALEIAKHKPDLIGLQEAAIIRTVMTTYPATPATHIELDMLDSLLKALEKLKILYRPIIILKGLDAQAPSVQGFDVRFTVQDVILIRSDRLKQDFKLSDPYAQNYQAQLTVVTPVGSVVNLAGFASVVVNFHGQKFRFVTTHLAVPFFTGLAVDISVPYAQANELIDFVSLSSPDVPTVLVGDFNSSANDPMHPTFATYSNFLGAGFTDTWHVVYPDNPGYTCCQAPDVRNINSLLNLRLDLILDKGFDVLDVELLGNNKADRIPKINVWPSDHAGVFASFRIQD